LEKQPRRATAGGHGDDSRSWNPAAALAGIEVVSLDLETTGLSAWRGDEVCEIGLVKATAGGTETLLSTFVKPGRPIPREVEAITGISDSDVADAPPIADVLPELIRAIGSRPIVAHNAPFDLAFLFRALQAQSEPMLANLAIDTLLVSRFINRGRRLNSLSHVSKRLGIDRGRSHRAADDARAAAEVFFALVPKLVDRGVETVGSLVQTRAAGPAAQFVESPSSVVLDMISRAIGAGAAVTMSYGRPPAEEERGLRIVPEELIADRELVASDAEARVQPGQEAPRRVFQVADILTLELEGRTFWSPWTEPAERNGAAGE
jgi:DNA polymerase III epsilon subunit family exonuclease